MYYSEISKIIEAGLNHDIDRVRSYSILLAKKMEMDGESRGSESISRVLFRKNLSKTTMDSLTPLPIDQESRMSIVDVDYNPSAESLILSDSVQAKLQDFLETIQNRKTIEDLGLEFHQSLLLYGFPGCGKTTAAKFIASKIQLPLVTARLDTLISSLLGATAKNIHKVFEYARKQPCVLFLDEFDAIAKARDDQYELGELKRVVNSLLQNMDEYCCDGILIAATNHHELLDNAIWRRFQSVIEMPKPGLSEIEKMIKLITNQIGVEQITDNQWKKIYQSVEGLSYSDIKTIMNNAIKKAFINNHAVLKMERVIGEVFLFINHGDFTKEEMAHYLLECSVPKKRIADYTGLSRRKIDQIEDTVRKND